MNLLMSHSVDVNFKDGRGRTPLHHAISFGFADAAEVLIGKHANVNASNNFGETCLHIASRKGFLGSVNLLLGHRANVNAVDMSGNAPLHLAAQHGHVAVAEALIAATATVDHLNAQNLSPLHEAITANEHDVVKSLLGLGGFFMIHGDGNGDDDCLFVCPRAVACLLACFRAPVVSGKALNPFRRPRCVQRPRLAWAIWRRRVPSRHSRLR